MITTVQLDIAVVESDLELARRLTAGSSFVPQPTAEGAPGVAALLRGGGAVAALLDVRDSVRIELAREVAGLPGARIVGVVDADDGETAASALAAGVTSFLTPDADPQWTRTVLHETIAGRASMPSTMTDVVLRAASKQLGERARQLAPRARLVEHARRSLEAPGALQPVFQPIADLQDHSVLGYLALTRFADVAPEHTGRRFADAKALDLGADLELAAARAALALLPRLPAGAALFVKLSCATVADPRAAELVDDATDGARVVMELAGHPSAAEAEAFYRTIQVLRDRGVRFSVDETGASFGALDRVLDLAPSFIRLAGGLTRDIDADRTRRALALSVVSFATHLGARVIADAIETADELAALRRVGVNYGLGFHIGRPGPLPEAPSGADGGDDQLLGQDGPTLWAARPARATLTVGRAWDFEESARSVLGALAQRIPGTVPYIALLDRDAGRVRIVEAGATQCPSLHRGATFPLDDLFDLAAAEGAEPQLGSATSRPIGARLGISAYGVVPFAGTPARPHATVSLAALSGPVHPEAVEVLREAGALLAEALRTEHGDTVHRQEQALRTLSWRDRFSGLFNAAHFREELEGAHARAVSGPGDTFAALVKVANHGGLSERMGQAVADMVLKDVARGLAAHAEPVDLLARVGTATFGCILYGRRPMEAEYFCRAVEDVVIATGRRREATIDFRAAHQRLGLGGSAEGVWEALAERALIGS
jgi:EAL domain-containing protein (putative c-di-GMP-specific phosphodiesterase class I)/GGDEF domain-containing protein